MNIPQNTLLKRFRLISSFLLGQGATQLIQVGSGLLLFRWLSVNDYAQYSMAFAFQYTAHVLVEFGFSGTIIALVGDRIHNKKVIGGYIKAGRDYRNKLFLIISLFCIIIFPVFSFKHNWSFFATLMLLISIIINLFFAGWNSYYTSPLRMHQKVILLYKIQIKSALVRLFALYILNITSLINAWIAALMGSLQILMNGFFTKKEAKVYIDESSTIDPEAQKEMIKLIRPLMPGIIFTAFQGQIMVFISSIFGQAKDIAEIGALSRIGQLYSVFSMAGGVLIAPYIARIHKKDLLRNFLAFVGGAIFFCSLIVFIIWIFPEPILWILGKNYDHLTSEIVLLLISSGIGLVNLIIWEMTESRKWIFTWDPIFVITGTIVIQIFCGIFFNLSRVYDILIMSLFVNAFVMLVRFTVTIYGLMYYKNDI